MPYYKIDTYLKIIFSISLISLISAFFIEYALGYQPCNLCLIQRIPYGLSIILIILNYLQRKNEVFFILLLILIFSFSLIISFYHFGIEQGFFEESTVCGIKNSSDIISKEELLKQLQEKTISCKDVTFRIFGFSLTTFNIIISLILVILLIKIFKNYEKFKR
jgi:disulfide bond formation protein DsbB|tara:strand:- start:68 stop:556 length:489 start_codon:yes stop_codon:yes gene_type:complete